jgi:hypothetical protein
VTAQVLVFPAAATQATGYPAAAQAAGFLGVYGNGNWNEARFVSVQLYCTSSDKHGNKNSNQY